MKFAFKSLIAAAAFAAVGAAGAASVTIGVGQSAYGLTFASGTGGLTFSSALVNAEALGGIAVSAIAPATYDTAKGAVSTTVNSVTVDTTSGLVTDAYTAGGALQTAATNPTGFVTTGGSLSVTNIHADLTNKRVYADLVGGNGIGSLKNFYLWDVTAINGNTSATVGTHDVSLTGLTITKAGFDTFATSLGLTAFGKTALSGVTDFGTMTSSIVVTGVPESSTYLMMGLGLVGISLARRRAK